MSPQTLITLNQILHSDTFPTNPNATPPQKSAAGMGTIDVIDTRSPTGQFQGRCCFRRPHLAIVSQHLASSATFPWTGLNTQGCQGIRVACEAVQFRIGPLGPPRTNPFLLELLFGTHLTKEWVLRMHVVHLRAGPQAFGVMA